MELAGKCRMGFAPKRTTSSCGFSWRPTGFLSGRSQPHFARLTSTHGVTFARGTRVEIELDEEQFAGIGAYTFSAVMDVFLGLYTSMNSFSQLVVRTRQRKRVLKQWPPRAGQKILM